MGGGSRAVGYQLLAHALQGHALFISPRVQFTQATHRIQIGTGKSPRVHRSARTGFTTCVDGPLHEATVNNCAVNLQENF